jgi:hypothetical protein
MKIYPRSYKYEAEQKCSEYDRNNLADVVEVLYNNCMFLQASYNSKSQKP